MADAKSAMIAAGAEDITDIVLLHRLDPDGRKRVDGCYALNGTRVKLVAWVDGAEPPTKLSGIRVLRHEGALPWMSQWTVESVPKFNLEREEEVLFEPRRSLTLDSSSPGIGE